LAIVIGAGFEPPALTISWFECDVIRPQVALAQKNRTSITRALACAGNLCRAYFAAFDQPFRTSFYQDSGD